MNHVTFPDNPALDSLKARVDQPKPPSWAELQAKQREATIAANLAEVDRARRQQDKWMAEQSAQGEAKMREWEREQRMKQPGEANQCNTVGYATQECPHRSIVDRLHAEARQLDQTIDRYRQVAELAMLLEKHPDVARIFELYYKVGI